MIETFEKLRRCSGILSTQSGGETILVRVRDGCFFGLGAIGSLVWARLASAGTLPEIMEYIDGMCGSLPESAATDVADFAEELRRERLIEPISSTAAEPDCTPDLCPVGCSLIYATPRLDRGTLRRAASGNSTHYDGGLTDSNMPGGLS